MVLKLFRYRRTGKNIREDIADVVYKTENGKFKAVVEEIVKRHAKNSRFW